MKIARIFTFSGRISRGAFWGISVIVFTIILLLFLIHEGAGVISYLISIPILFATSVKRWHDRDKSGVWLLIGFIPIVGLWALIETGFLSGTPGDNRFGEPDSGSPFE